MLLAPDYNAVSAPYGLKNASSQDLFDALNAAIADVQRTDKDENLLTENHRTDLVRAYSCRQDTQLPVPNRNATTGYLRDILFNTKTLRIGGLGPSNWGPHDGDYTSNTTVGFYPRLLEAIVETLGKLKGPDGFVYGEGLKINRTFYPTEKLLFQALLDGGIHATDVYLLVDAPYQGTGETCSNDTQCRARESCEKGTCSHSPRSRSIHFRTTCTTASRTTKFITKKNSRRFPNDIGLVSRLIRQADAPSNNAMPFRTIRPEQERTRRQPLIKRRKRAGLVSCCCSPFCSGASFSRCSCSSVERRIIASSRRCRVASVSSLVSRKKPNRRWKAWTPSTITSYNHPETLLTQQVNLMCFCGAIG